MHFRRKGSVAIFLALMLGVLSAFITALSSYARIYTEKGEAVRAVDNAVRSCFAEYNRELFDRFHILVIDSSYKTYDNGKDRVAGHFATYIENSMNASGLSYADIEECRDAAGSNGEYVYCSGIAYARERLGVDDRLTEDNDNAYFLTYLLDVLGNNAFPSEGSFRMGETEYLLYGYGSDEENINMAVMSYEEREEDLSYEDYLCARLEEEDISTVRSRFCELLTEYMRENGSPGFDLETCYHDISFIADVQGGVSGEYTITRKYSYDISHI